MCSLRCCSFAVPVVAVLSALAFSLATDGQVWDLIPGWRVADMPDQSGKVAIVTGPTMGGIGYESAKELARKGAHVIMAGRSKSKGARALEALKKELPDAKVEFAELDLSSFASVRRFSEDFSARSLPLHILLNNAGVMMNPFTLTEDGFESQFATNHLGHFLLTRLLMPALESSAPSRVVTVSSAAAYFPELMTKMSDFVPAEYLPANVSEALDFSQNLRADHEAHYSPFLAYGRSKLANVLFARALDRRVLSKGVRSNACHPGGVGTNLPAHLRASVGRSVGDVFLRLLDAIALPLLLTPSQGAVTQLFLATASEVEAQNIHGHFYRPQATPWTLPSPVSEELEEHLWKVSELLTATSP